MNSWFTVKVKYTKQNEDGTFKRVTEPYLLAAMTFTDAETRIYEELGDIIKGEFHVTSIVPTNYHDIFSYDNTENWFKCTISFMGENEGSEKLKKTKQTFLVSANSVKQANDNLQESLSGLMIDYKIESVNQTKIVDIFPFKSEE